MTFDMLATPVTTRNVVVDTEVESVVVVAASRRYSSF